MVIYGDDTASRAGTLTLVGGELALDFANTSSGRGWPTHREHLRSAADIVDWAGHAPVLPPEDAAWLREATCSQPELGERLLASALTLREDIYTVGAEIAAGRPAPAERIESLFERTRFASRARDWRPSEVATPGVGWSGPRRSRRCWARFRSPR